MPPVPPVPVPSVGSTSATMTQSSTFAPYINSSASSSQFAAYRYSNEDEMQVDPTPSAPFGGFTVPAMSPPRMHPQQQPPRPDSPYRMNDRMDVSLDSEQLPRYRPAIPPAFESTPTRIVPSHAHGPSSAPARAPSFVNSFGPARPTYTQPQGIATAAIVTSSTSTRPSPYYSAAPLPPPIRLEVPALSYPSGPSTAPPMLNTVSSSGGGAPISQPRSSPGPDSMTAVLRHHPQEDDRHGPLDSNHHHDAPARPDWFSRPHSPSPLSPRPVHATTSRPLLERGISEGLEQRFSLSPSPVSPPELTASGSGSASASGSLSTTAAQSNESERALVPLDDLQSKIINYQRRDPTDESALRKFSGLRLTPPATLLHDRPPTP